MKTRAERNDQFNTIRENVKEVAQKNLVIAVLVQELTNTAIEGILEASEETPKLK